MREPAFWRRKPGLAAALLRPAAAAYGAVAGRLLQRPGARIGIPVICIGNLTVGGAGKTPTAIAIAQFLRAAGKNPFFLTRGYGGTQPGPLRVDPARHHASEVGDEPLLLARVAPTIVARERVAGAQAAHAAGADTIVMDDGFQNPSLEKDFSLIVIDSRRGVGNGRVIPAGPLRAPPGAQLARASAVLVIGDGGGAAGVIAVARTRGLPILQGRLAPDSNAVAALLGRKVLAFAGIGDPQKFFATLEAAGVPTPITLPFPDHHRYSGAEAADILARAERDHLILLTTEKDFARMAGEPALAALAARTRVLPVSLMVTEQDTLHAMVLAAVEGETLTANYTG
jgi:tetraacyldisaccharide 4'-kinase